MVAFGEWLTRSTALLVNDSNRKVQLTDLVGVISLWALKFSIFKIEKKTFQIIIFKGSSSINETYTRLLL